MAHFYGRVNGNRGEASRLGHAKGGLSTIAASYSGAVRVDLYVDKATGTDCARVSLIPWEGAGVTRVVFEGPVSGEAS